MKQKYPYSTEWSRRAIERKGYDPLNLAREIWETRRYSTVLNPTKKSDTLRKGDLQITAKRGYPRA
jgi:hypothetical protein